MVYYPQFREEALSQPEFVAELKEALKESAEASEKPDTVLQRRQFYSYNMAVAISRVLANLPT